jgi:serine/threonine protein kinase
MHQKSQIRRVFWVQLEWSAWRGTELASFQSWNFNVDMPLTAINDPHAREARIVEICEEIAMQVETIGKDLESDFAFVRQIILDHSGNKNLIVDSPIPEGKGKGTFAVVCRGRLNKEQVAIKVLRRTPIRHLSDEFSGHVDSREKLSHQCFIKVRDHFHVNEGLEKYTVLVEEFISADSLDRCLNDKDKQKKFTIGEVAILLRRGAEALEEFHEKLGGTETYGLLTPDHVYYDERGHKLLMPAVGVSNFLWHTMGWERLATWQNPGNRIASYIAPEQAPSRAGTNPNKNITHHTDQYLLGQLIFEILEGRLPFNPQGGWEEREKFWKAPHDHVQREWRLAHKVFADIIFRMLRLEPSERWETFGQLIKRLRTMEDESRALAKRSFEGTLTGHDFKLKDNKKFFLSFYNDFFFREIPTARAKFTRGTEAQADALMDAMVAVLNFNASNEPTLLSNVVSSHKNSGVKPEEVQAFYVSFEGALEKELESIPDNDLRTTIKDAWKDVFLPVVEYFKEGL